METKISTKKQKLLTMEYYICKNEYLNRKNYERKVAEKEIPRFILLTDNENINYALYKMMTNKGSDLDLAKII